MWRPHNLRGAGEYEPRDALLRRSSPQFTFKGVDPKVAGGLSPGKQMELRLGNMLAWQAGPVPQTAVWQWSQW